MSLYKSQYDGFKIGLIVSDDITDKILPFAKTATEAYHKSKNISDKKLTDAAVRLIKSKCIK